MKRRGQNSRALATGLSAAIVLAVFTWWIVSGLGICPSDGDLAPQCRAEADRIGLGAAAMVGGFVALVTAAIALFNRRVDR